MVPDGLRYTKEHEWLRISGDEAVVGITHHAQKELGDITFVEIPAVGKTVKARDALAVVESVKAASDIFAPVGGTVARANEGLAAEPERVNKDPYGDGWIAALKPFSAADVGALLTAAQYRAFLAGAKPA
jgi:glycine cleavage system H protein